jgi:putative DNA primase/helicase
MRRYWPILCKEISLDALASQREQVFAEAIVRYNSGDHWYDMPERATDEQLDRAGDVDAWTGPVLDYMDTIWNERVKLEVNAAQILERSDLKVEPSKHNTELCRRVSRILKANGWIAKHTKYGDVWKKVERREPT